MEQFNVDLLIKTGVPLLTFILGVVITLVTKRREKRRTDIKERVTSTAKLVNDWYNQIHQLALNIRTATSATESQRAIYFYVRNRIVLPELKLHLDFLRERNGAVAFVAAVDGFLGLVTTSRAASVLNRDNWDAQEGGEGEFLACRELFGNTDEQDQRRDEEAQWLLDMLDIRLQRVTILASQALTKES
jgi:uncharacterized membrane protein